MIKLRISELIKAKEKELGRKISTDEIASEIGMSRITISKIINSNDYRTNTFVLDKLCHYFNCKDISELITYIPDENLDRRELRSLDIKMNRLFFKEKFPDFIKNNLDKIDLISKESKITKPFFSNDESSNTYIDLMVTDVDNKNISIMMTAKLYWGFDLKRFENLLKLTDGHVVFITCTKFIPIDLLESKNRDNLSIYYSKILYNDYADEIVDVELEKVL